MKSFFLNIVEIKTPGSKYWLKYVNHYVLYKILQKKFGYMLFACKFGSFYNPTPLFLQGFHNFYVINFFLDNDMQPLLSVCFHIQFMSFNLEQQQPASYFYLFRKRVGVTETGPL